jgi:hypothetical protein
VGTNILVGGDMDNNGSSELGRVGVNVGPIGTPPSPILFYRADASQLSSFPVFGNLGQSDGVRIADLDFDGNLNVAWIDFLLNQMVFVDNNGLLVPNLPTISFPGLNPSIPTSFSGPIVTDIDGDGVFELVVFRFSFAYPANRGMFIYKIAYNNPSNSFNPAFVDIFAPVRTNSINEWNNSIIP